MYVLNTWYVVAWSHEVARQPVRRVVCEKPVVLYRTKAGTVTALADRCAHRAYPLSAGRLVGDSIECGYHGFAYGPDGVCTRVPAQESIPARAVVAKYPIVEKDGWLWIWLGDPASADPATVPDTHWMNDPDWATVTHTMLFECRHDLIHDNLLDLTHESFLHKTTVGDDYIYEHGITVEVDGNVVTVDRLMPGVEAPPLYARTMSTEGAYDRFHATEFHVPSYHVLHSGITEQGRPREEGYLIKVLNGITPVDAHTTWYYYAFSRNFAVDAEWATKELEVGLETVLREDADALKHQELAMQERPATEHDVLIGQDAGVAKARRILSQLLTKEQVAANGAPAATPARPTAGAAH
ncbi:MAG TPA: aromatic ring-hydroxylating dioxygenase subunit alpha [Nocardioidaceae bacterium]|nr:aromatic ring-hydroxylating dioxygenase subunit alpha [Nocardioidaceae bacterium]